MFRGDHSSAPAAPAAEILTIGDELCRGEIVDTNSSWLAERLTLLGLHVRYRSSVTDDPADLLSALRLATTRAEVVVTSGGLGPTEDDRTVDAVSALLGTEPVAEPEHLARMEARYAERGFALTPNNLRQVRIPGGSEALPNRAGAAPGFLSRLPRVSTGPSGSPANGEVLLYSVPGVPREMKRIFDEEIEPRLRAWTTSAGHAVPAVARRTWRVAALGESHVDHRLRGLLDAPAGETGRSGPLEGATLHYRIAFPENLVTVIVRRRTPGEAEAVLEALDAEVRARLGQHVYGTGDETLARVVGRLLGERGETLGAAESCTGGLFSDQVTDVPGSSGYFRGAVVAYDNSIKESLLGVRPGTLAAHGAVSEECVREMAEGARRALGTTWAVALSGVAGPGGGSAEKPVGLVHYAVAGPEALGGVEARHVSWPGERRMVKLLAASTAMYTLYRRLLAATRGPAPEPVQPPEGAG